MRWFPFLFLGFCFFLPVEPLQADSASTGTFINEKTEKHREKEKERDAEEKEHEDEDDEPNTVIESITLDDGRQVLRVKNDNNENMTITAKNEDGTVREITKTLSSKSRAFDNELQDVEISPSSYYPPPVPDKK